MLFIVLHYITAYYPVCVYAPRDVPRTVDMKKLNIYSIRSVYPPHSSSGSNRGVGVGETQRTSQTGSPENRTPARSC